MNFTNEEREKLLNKGNIILDNTLFADFYSMEDNEIASLMKAIGRYAGTGEFTTFTKDDRIVKMAFNRFRISHDANCRKYLDTCRKSTESINKRWNKNKNSSTETEA